MRGERFNGDPGYGFTRTYFWIRRGRGSPP